MNRIYVAMTFGYFGIGTSIEEAKAKARKAGAKAKKTDWLVKRMPEGAYDVRVDEYGSILWSVPEGVEPGRPEIVEAPKAKE